MWNWDYKIPNNWQPKTDREWEWYLVRKINYDDFKGLQKNIIKKHFQKIKRLLDPGKQIMFANFLKDETQ